MVWTTTSRTAKEQNRCTRYEAMKGGAKCRKWCGLGWLGALKVMSNVIIRYSGYEFLFNFIETMRLSYIVFEI